MNSGNGKGAAHAGGGDQIFHYDPGIMGLDSKLLVRIAGNVQKS
jgi:hypothetical protein